MADLPTPSLRDIKRHLSEELRPYRRSLALTSALAVATSLVEVMLVYMIATLGAAALSGKDRPVALPDGIEVSRRSLAFILVAVVVARGVLDLVNGHLQQRALARYETQSRIGVMDAFVGAEWPMQAEQEPATVYNAVYNYLGQARQAFQRLIESATSAMSFAVMLVGSFVIGGVWVLAIMVFSVLLAIGFRPLSHRAHHASEASRTENLAFGQAITATVTLARDFRLFGVESTVRSRNAQVIRRLATANLRAGISQYQMSSLYTSVIYLVAATGLALAVLLDFDNPAPFITVVLLLYRGLGYGRSLQASYQGLVVTMPSITSLHQLRLEWNTAQIPTAGEPFTPPLEVVNFDDVHYSYGSHHPALDGVTFSIRRGDALGIVGPSGSGKSTLVQLLLRLRQPTKGRILINGKSLSLLQPNSWFGTVVLVPQEPQLLSGTVIENVQWLRRNISETAAIEALGAAHVLDEMNSLPDGLSTRIGPGGNPLSGGQRQRLSIARALAGSPSVLVLDEPTSALDPVSEERIRETLQGLRGRTTLVVIAHRFSTLRICDRILVLKGGQVEASGPQSDLEQQDGYLAEAAKLARLS